MAGRLTGRFASQATTYQWEWYNHLVLQGGDPDAIHGKAHREALASLSRMPLRPPTGYAALGMAATAFRKALAAGRARFK